MNKLKNKRSSEPNAISQLRVKKLMKDANVLLHSNRTSAAERIRQLNKEIIEE